MLCLVCGAEMRLVEVVQDTTMLVPGYEHHTWQCSGCSIVEQRLTFSREKTPAAKVPVGPTHPEPPAVEQQTTFSREETPAAKVPVEPTHPEPPAAKLQTSAWAKAVEKLRRIEADRKERATAAREAANEAERHAQFNRDWGSSLAPLASSEASSRVKPDEVRPPTEPTASPAPTAHDETIPPASKT
jgi:hypothetical protein